jgi:hypothetical protein
MKIIDSFKATEKGFYLVIFSSLVFMISGLILGVYFSDKYEIHIGLAMMSCIVLSLLIYCPIWSFILFKWRKWAFTNVDNINMLIKLSESKNLIYPDNHFYSKYEVCSKTEKIELNILREKRIKEKFNVDIYKDYKTKKFTLKRKIALFFNQKELLKFNINGIIFNQIGEIPWRDFEYCTVNFDKSLINSTSYRNVWINYKLKKDKTVYKYDLGTANNLSMNYFRLEYLLEIYKKLNT